MRRKGNAYEYVALYVDDLAIAMKDPKEFTDTLENKNKLKLKGTGPITFHKVWTFIVMIITPCAFHQPNTSTS
jgi:hypothetical protein